MVLRSPARLGPLLVLLAAAAGCSLLTNVDGLSGGNAADAGSTTSEGGAQGDATTSGSDGSTDGGGGDATTKYLFTDDFNRPDTTSGIGNGWNEKEIGFRLSGGEAERFMVGTDDYRDTIASRPTAETVGDVEVSVEFRFKVGGGGYVQVHARAQTATLSMLGTLDSYIFFRNLNVNDNRTFTIARQRGTDIFDTLKDFKTTSSLDTASTFRIRLRVTGGSPVELSAFVERKDGATWNMIGMDTFSDGAANRIATPGVVGLSAGSDPTGVFAYDNFSAQGL